MFMEYLRSFLGKKSQLPGQIALALLAILLFVKISPVVAQNRVGLGTVTPSTSAILDLTSANTGMLVPRMSTVAKLAIVSPATGLIVYDNTLNTFYYYNSTAWVPFVTSSGAAGGWQTVGNAGTTAGTNFVGTTDAQDMIFKTNATEGMRLTTGWNLGVGTTTPTSILHTVASGAKILNYTGNLLTNTATSSTASITKYGTEVLSTGTWNGTSATNIGLHVNATGGTTTYSGVLEGGNVGVNTTTPATFVDVAGDISTRSSTFTAANGTNNDIAIGTSSFVRLVGPSAAYTIAGIAGGVDGKTLTLFNSTTQTITIANENASSTAANRITTLSSQGDIVIAGKGGVDMIYSAADSRWLVIASATTISSTTTGTIIKRKSADESVNNSATLQNDDELFLPMAANDSMQVEGYIDAQGFSGGKDFKISFSVPAGATLNIYANWNQHGAVGQAVFKATGDASGTIDYNPVAPLEQGVIFFGTVVTGNTAGNVQLTWAQFSASTTSNTFKAGSYMQGTYIR
jgi:hypothetical protein